MSAAWACQPVTDPTRTKGAIQKVLNDIRISPPVTILSFIGQSFPENTFHEPKLQRLRLS